MTSKLMQQIAEAKKRHQGGIGIQNEIIARCPLGFELSFRIVDEQTKPLEGIPYNTEPSGVVPDHPHLPDGNTDRYGKTRVVSEIENEAIDFYLSWPKVKINTGFIKR